MSTSGRVAIGVFLIGGFILFGIGLFWIGDRRQLFASNIDLYTEFANISGLAKGAKVRVAGLDAGEVLDIQIPPNPDVRFRVHFRALSEFKSILRMNSTASIQNDGLVGNKFLQVDAGTSAAMPATAGTTIPSREPIEIADVIFRVNETVKTANQAVTDIRSGVNDTVKTILNLTQQTTQAVADVSDQASKLTRTGNAIGEEVRVIVSNVRNGRGTLGQLITDDKFYQQLRAAADQSSQVIEQFKQTSSDFREISNDLKQRDLGTKVERVASNLDTLTKEAISAIRSFQGPEGASGGLMAEVRQTLTSASETMANFADSSEALKRNFLFRGFFNKRGYFDLDDISVKQYREGQALRDRQKIAEWVNATDLFTSTPDGKEQLTNEGRRKLDAAMTNFLRYSKNEPLVVESFAGTGSESERVLRGRERGIMVSEYLVKKFALKSNYVAVMPMNAAGNGEPDTRDGIGLALFPPKPAKK